MPQGLGKGLGSLIPKKIFTPQELAQSGVSSQAGQLLINQDDFVVKIPPQLIKANPWQPRRDFPEEALQDLIVSIKQYGIIQPLIVTKKGSGYELVAGERRLRAAISAGLSEVPAIVREADEQKKLELAIIENVQREDLNPIETAFAYQKLIDEFNISQEEVAKKVGRARSTVANCLRLLSLPEEIRRALAQKKISEAHAKQLLSLENEAQQLNMFKKIVRNNLTVSETDKEVKRISPAKGKSVGVNSYLDQEQALGRALDTKVEIRRQGQSGKIVIHFFGDDDLGALIAKLKKVR